MCSLPTTTHNQLHHILSNVANLFATLLHSKHSVFANQIEVAEAHQLILLATHSVNRQPSPFYQTSQSIQEMKTSTRTFRSSFLCLINSGSTDSVDNANWVDWIGLDKSISAFFGNNDITSLKKKKSFIILKRSPLFLSDV